MKKYIKIVAAIMVCVLICCGGSVLAMNVHEDDTERVDDGYCAPSDMIYWIIKKNVLAGNVFYYLSFTPKNDPSYNDVAHPEYRQIKDCAVKETESDAKWIGVTDNATGQDVVIKSVEIANGIEGIGTNAFRGQSSIEMVILHPSVKKIGEGAFDGCTGINKISYYGTEAQWRAMTIGDNNGLFNTDYDTLVSEGKLEDKYAVLGDVDLDGDVDKNDATAIANYIAGNTDGTTIKLSAADVNGDGEINVCDCVKIMLLVDGKISKF